MQWVAIARTLWAHRRKVYAAAAMLAPFALTTLLLVFVLFAGGGSPATNEAALTTPQCAQQMQSQGVDPGRGVQFGPGPVNNGKAVIAAGLQMRIPEKGIILALATAMQESGMRNLANPNVPESLRIPNEGLGHDHQSVGIFQQQPWWGTIRDLMTPRIAALKFYAGLLKVGGWQQMAPTVAAQSVQQSAFPDAYADDVAAATLFYRQHLREVLTAAGPGASTPDSMDSDETENLCAASRPRASRSVYNLSKLPPGKAPEDRLQRYTILTNRAVSAAFPQIKTIGGYRPDSMKWHPQGLALDIMVSSAYPPLSPQGIALGNGIRDFLLKNAKTLGVDHVIWRQHIYYPNGTSEPMENRGGLTANHFDHVHVATIGGGYPTPASHPRRRRTHAVLRNPADPRTRRRRDRHPVGPGRATGRDADRLRRRADVLARRAAPVTEAARRPTVARCAITTGLALILAAVAGWLFLSAAPAAPLAQADTAGKASDTGLQRDTIAANHAVSEAFPQIEQIGGFRPDPLHEHDEGLALDIPFPGDPTSPEGIALGDAMRDFLLSRADELGINHVL